MRFPHPPTPPQAPPADASAALPGELRWDAERPGIALLLSRRQFLKAAGAVAALATLPVIGAQRSWAFAHGRYFTRHEFDTLGALCDRVLPPDTDPGASELGAARYISRMLTALDRHRPRVFAGGPFSRRNPYPDNDVGAPAKKRPRNSFRRFTPLTRLQELTWHTELYGSASVPEVAVLDAQFGGPKKGLRDVYREGATADAFMLAASPIESARLCLLSGNLGNSSDQVGRNLMFHLQNNVNGFLPERVHGERGRAVTHAISDFRGVEPGGESIRVFSTTDGPRLYLGGICECGASQGQPITEDGKVYAIDLPQPFGRRFGIGLKNAMRDGALGQHLFALIMQAEDAPQLTNRVDLDPTIVDVFDRPVPRVTYSQHDYEKQARLFYVPIMKQVLLNAGATQVFVNPCDVALGGAPGSRHVMGTLRMGNDPATSVVDPNGRFHDVDNLYACDGSVFPTSAGWNPTLTIFAVSAKIAHAIAGTLPA